MVAEKAPNYILLDAGAAFFEKSYLVAGKEASSRLKAKTIIEGYNQIAYDVINVGMSDLAAGQDFLQELIDSSQAHFISANIIVSGTGAEFLKPSVIINKEGLKVGVLGLTTSLPKDFKGLELKNYIIAGQEEIKKLREQVDIVVVLMNAPRADMIKARAAFKSADYIFLSREASRTRPEMAQKDAPPLVYSLNIQGKYIARVDIEIQDKYKALQNITPALISVESINNRMGNLQKRDPGKLLDDIYKDNDNITKLIKKYRKSLADSKLIIDSAVNRSNFTLVALDKKVASEKQLLSNINAVLKTCLELDGPKVAEAVK